MGESWSTPQLAQKLEKWQQHGDPIVFIIGGPDGLDVEVLKLADCKLSMSKMTFPHPLAKVMLIEQLYRADSILKNHPYHRE